MLQVLDQMMIDMFLRPLLLLVLWSNDNLSGYMLWSMGFFVSYHGVFVYMWRAAIFLHVSDAST
jgi:hypothetical protein